MRTLVALTIFPFALIACTSTPPETDTEYSVKPGYWTSESLTNYSGDAAPAEPYIHDYCLGEGDVTGQASLLATSMAEFIAGDRGTCVVDRIDDAAFRFTADLSCTIDGAPVAGQLKMIYAEDGSSTDMDVNLTSPDGAEPASFTRTAKQEFLRDDCPVE